MFKPKHLQNFTPQPFQIDDSKIECSETVRNLGAYLDSSLSMEYHTNKICQSAYFHLRKIGMIRNLIDADTCKLLINSFVTSRLDYCNSLLYGINTRVIDKLQKVQNRAARIITRTKLREHITPVLKHLHWLPIQQRIKYKILCQTYKCIHNLAPEYLQDLLVVRDSTRCLRSSSTVALERPKAKSVFSERAFSVSAPKLWNSLSRETRSSQTASSFKTHLKTELFREAFGV